MSIATYRGVKYDTKDISAKSKDWKVSLSKNGLDNFQYRGKEYKWEGHKNVWTPVDPEKTKEKEQTKSFIVRAI